MKKHILLKQRMTILFTIFLLLISLACLTLTSTATPESGTVSDEVNVEFGSGTFIFPDPKEGLAELNSYQATLTLAFDGTQTGQAQQWSKTYIMLVAKDSATHQLTIEKAGNINDIETIYMAESDGIAYEWRGENDCTATIIEEENSLSERLEPAGFLNAVIGADEAGSETINTIATNHYTFDESAFGQSNITQSTGEMWIASDGGYILKYLLTTKANADYFGEEIAGTLTWNYELSNINQPITFTLPDNCPSGLVHAPTLTDATDILNMPGLLTYHTSTNLADTATFYQEQIPNLGWELSAEPTFTETTALLEYIQDDQTLTIIVIADESGATINILLGKPQK